jgi:hypothetical protein
MSTPLYEPLRVTPPLTTNHVRMAWVLRAQEAGRKALDAALAAPRKVAGYLRRAVHALHLDAAASWLRRIALRAARPLVAVASRLGTSGVLAGATALITSRTGRSLLNSTLRATGRTLSWTARAAYSLLDRGLRCFGRVGNQAADKLFGGVVSLGGKVAAVAAPVVHRVARLSNPAAPQARVVSALCRSYLLHRLLKGFVGNPWLRLLIEAVLIPAVIDSRLAVWLRGVLQEARTRAQTLQEQARVVVELQRQETAQAEQLLLPTELTDLPVAAGAEDVQLPVAEIPAPGNRAERRAAQRKRPQQ